MSYQSKIISSYTSQINFCSFVPRILGLHLCFHFDHDYREDDEVEGDYDSKRNNDDDVDGDNVGDDGDVDLRLNLVPPSYLAPTCASVCNQLQRRHTGVVVIFTVTIIIIITTINVMFFSSPCCPYKSRQAFSPS